MDGRFVVLKEEDELGAVGLRLLHERLDGRLGGLEGLANSRLVNLHPLLLALLQERVQEIAEMRPCFKVSIRSTILGKLSTFAPMFISSDLNCSN